VSCVHTVTCDEAIHTCVCYNKSFYDAEIVVLMLSDVY